jgi:hypothetical protein
MSYKTDRLLALFPAAYGATDRESLLYKLLDVIGAEFMTADAKIKDLLKSHWVRYATGPGLDALGSIYNVERRILRDGTPESDEAFRSRLQSIVPLFTGGGTVEAVLGAVRSALGLPFNLDDLKIPANYQALRSDIENLVTIQEFSPVAQRVLGSTVTEVANASELVLVVDVPTVSESRPRIDWTFDQGDGRALRLERMDTATGVRSLDGFTVPAGKTLTFSADADGQLSAVLDGTDVSASFVNLNGSTPAILPMAPVTRSEWKFRSRSGFFDLAVFDGPGAFDLPDFHVALSLILFQPLTFEVRVPFFLQQAVQDLKAHYRYRGDLLVFQGLPPERIQEVIDQTRAAGVKGSIQFTLNFIDGQNQDERFHAAWIHSVREDAGAADSLLVSDVNDRTESQDANEHFAIGAVFDISNFDHGYGLV